MILLTASTHVNPSLCTTSSDYCTPRYGFHAIPFVEAGGHRKTCIRLRWICACRAGFWAIIIDRAHVLIRSVRHVAYLRSRVVRLRTYVWAYGTPRMQCVEVSCGESIHTIVWRYMYPYSAWRVTIYTVGQKSGATDPWPHFRQTLTNVKKITGRFLSKFRS